MNTGINVKNLKYIIFFLLLCWIFYPEKSYTFILPKVTIPTDVDSGPEEYQEPPAQLPPEPIPAPQPFKASPIKPIDRCVRIKAIHPSRVPWTKPWWYRGPLTLRQHIQLEHFVLPEMIVLFETESDLKKLHSFLHNGGNLANL
jgi:hypothetical protein